MGKIIWLASYPKSGNTWLRVFLHNLLRNPVGPFDINKLSYITHTESAIEHYRDLETRPPEQWSKAETARLRLRAHERLTGKSADNVFVKTHCALMTDHGVSTVNLKVTAGTVYVVRNPLDVVVSFAAHMGMTIDESIALLARPGARTLTGGGYVCELRGSWSEHVASWTTRPHPSLRVVRYEDLLQAPWATFGGLARFLGLAPSEERLDRAIAMSSFDELRAQERRSGFREKSDTTEMFFREGRIDQWRDALSPAQVAAVVKVHRAQMARFGYVPEGY